MAPRRKKDDKGPQPDITPKRKKGKKGQSEDTKATKDTHMTLRRTRGKKGQPEVTNDTNITSRPLKGRNGQPQLSGHPKTALRRGKGKEGQAANTDDANTAPQRKRGRKGQTQGTNDTNIAPQRKNVEEDQPLDDDLAPRREESKDGQSHDKGKAPQRKNVKKDIVYNPRKMMDLDAIWNRFQNRPIESISDWLEQGWTEHKVPGITPDGYQPKGKLLEIGGAMTYQAGDVYSAKGLIVVFDVFGFTNQTFRIADGLALSLNALILMPDLFDNEPLPLSIYPPDTDQKEKTMRDFFRGKANVNAGMQKLATVVNDAQVMFVHTERWGIYGFGWGGKLATLASGSNSAFEVGGVAHPGHLDLEDAKALSIPFICLFSKEDGETEFGQAYANAIFDSSRQNEVHVYNTMHHGWMGARSDFESEENITAFNRGYNQLASFFADHLPDQPLTQEINQMFVWVPDKSHRQGLLGWREDTVLENEQGLMELNEH